MKRLKFDKGIDTYAYINKYGDCNYVKSYKDVPGFINEAENIYDRVCYELLQLKLQDPTRKYKVVELGTFLGRGTLRMCQLIREYGLSKEVDFDTIDIFYLPPYIVETVDHWDESTFVGIPPQYKRWVKQCKELPHLPNNMEVCQHAVKTAGYDNEVNFINCDSQYAYKLYEDNSIDFMWIDASHEYEQIKNDIINFWPKIKQGGILAGDDYNDENVRRAFKDAKYEIGREDIAGTQTTDISFLIYKK